MFKTTRTLLVIVLLASCCMGCSMRQIVGTALSAGAAYGLSQIGK